MSVLSSSPTAACGRAGMTCVVTLPHQGAHLAHLPAPTSAPDHAHQADHDRGYAAGDGSDTDWYVEGFCYHVLLARASRLRPSPDSHVALSSAAEKVCDLPRISTHQVHLPQHCGCAEPGRVGPKGKGWLRHCQTQPRSICSRYILLATVGAGAGSMLTPDYVWLEATGLSRWCFFQITRCLESAANPTRGHF